MSIKFICSCGKRLRARDDMAARRSVCPRCGAPVGIPALQPAHGGTAAGPMTPAERLQAARWRRSPGTSSPPASPAVEAARVSSRTEPPRELPIIAPMLGPEGGWRLPLESTLVRLVARASSGGYLRRQQLETHWHECLFFAFDVWRFVLALAFGLAGLMVVAALAWAARDELGQIPVGIWPLYLPVAVLPFLILGNACGWVGGVLTSAAAGEVKYIRWPGQDVRLALKSCVTWIVCFLAGPAELLGASLLYWIHCGDPVLLDWLILAELNVVAVAYGLLALLAVSREGRLRDAHPGRVAELVERLGWEGLVPVLVAAALAPAHGLWLVAALEELHLNAAAGGLFLIACWGSGLFWAVFVCRWLGVCFYRSGKKKPSG